MKKTISIILIITAGIAAYSFWDRAHHQLPDLRQLAPEVVLENIQSQISTPGPLRSKTSAPDSHLTADGVFALTNQQRAQNNLSALNPNQQLTEAAAAKVKDMFAQQYFEHISPKGLGPADLARQANYDYVSVGENLALGNFEDDQTLVQAWMNSPGHRANILSAKFSEIGVAVGQGWFEGQQTWLAVQEFGRPSSACPKVDQFLKDQIQRGRTELDGLLVQLKRQKSELDAANSKTKEEVNAYNQKVKEYNDSVNIYNNRLDAQKNLENEYNSQVRAFNQCLSN